MEWRNYKLINMNRLFIILTFSFLSCENLNQSKVNFISENQFNEITDSDFYLIDVRTKEEFKSGHIQNAIHIDFYSDSFQSKILNLKKDSKIILYCRTNNRSSKSADFLFNNDYKDISVIEGGITSWVKNGNDITYPKLD